MAEECDGEQNVSGDLVGFGCLCVRVCFSSLILLVRRASVGVGT